MNACVYRFRCCFICVSVPLFICLYVLLGGWVHVSRGQAVPVKGVTLPMYSVAEAFFWSSFLSMSLTLLLLFLSSHVPESLCPDLCEMYTQEAHVSVGCFRRRAGPAGQTTEEIPQAHMELLSPVWTLRGGSSSSLSSEGAPEVGWARKGCKLGGLGSDNETEDEERIGTNRREKMGGWKERKGRWRGRQRERCRGPGGEPISASLVYIISFINHAARVWRLVCNYAKSACHQSDPSPRTTFCPSVMCWGMGSWCVTFREALQCRRALKPLWPKGVMGASCWNKTYYCRLFLAWKLQGVKYSWLVTSSNTLWNCFGFFFYLLCPKHQVVKSISNVFCVAAFKCCWEACPSQGFAPEL